MSVTEMTVLFWIMVFMIVAMGVMAFLIWKD